MNTFKRTFIDGPWGQIHCRVKRPEATHKPPLVCLHMFPQSGRNFEAFLNHYPDNRLLVAPDFPGYGESTCPPQQINATDYANSIWHTVDALSLLDESGKIDLFGIHAGAKLATEVARLRPQAVNHIALSSAAVLYPEELEELKKAFFPTPLDQDGTRIKMLWNLLIRNRGPEQTLEMLATSLAEMMRAGENYEWGHYAVYEFNTHFPKVLSGLEHPIALINVDDDLYKMTTRTEAHLNNGRLYDFPNWGQGFLEANAAEVAPVIDRLLDNPLNYEET